MAHVFVSTLPFVIAYCNPFIIFAAIHAQFVVPPFSSFFVPSFAAGRRACLLQMLIPSALPLLPATPPPFPRPRCPSKLSSSSRCSCWPMCSCRHCRLLSLIVILSSFSQPFMLSLLCRHSLHFSCPASPRVVEHVCCRSLFRKL